MAHNLFPLLLGFARGDEYDEDEYDEEPYDDGYDYNDGSEIGEEDF